MTEMVERVAKALESEWMREMPSDVMPPSSFWRSSARAAIEAMREPTRDMASPGFFVDAWQRAIDAALKSE